MTTTRRSWITEDRLEVAKIVAGGQEGLPGWTVTPVAHPRRKFVPPAHTSHPDPPSIFLGWSMGGYQEVGHGYFSDSGPSRKGYINLLWWVQPGRGGGALLDPPETGYYDQLLQLFFSAEDGGHTYFTFNPPIPIADRTAMESNVAWHVEGFKLRFVVG